MEKVIYCLWRPAGADVDTWSKAVRQAASDIVAPGAVVTQVNVDDGPVQHAAIRFCTFDTPIAAVVTVWFDTAADHAVRGAVESALRTSTEKIAGYLVTESVPLRAPSTEPGIRTNGFANLAFLRRPPNLDQSTWLARWQGDHTAVAIATQSTFGYVQNVVVHPVTDQAPPIDGIVEELFNSDALTDFHVFFDTDGDDRLLGERMEQMQASVAAFSGPDAVLDVTPTSRYCLGPPPPP